MFNNANDNFSFTFDVRIKLQEIILFCRVKFPYHLSCFTQGCIVDSYWEQTNNMRTKSLVWFKSQVNERDGTCCQSHLFKTTSSGLTIQATPTSKRNADCKWQMRPEETYSTARGWVSKALCSLCFLFSTLFSALSVISWVIKLRWIRVWMEEKKGERVVEGVGGGWRFEESLFGMLRREMVKYHKEC